MSNPVHFQANRNYIPALDSLRAISIIFVVLRHFDITRLVSANLGVTIFFFISGFIITRLMLHEHDTTNGVKVYAFYLRRFFRLIPELFLMLIVVVIAALILGANIDWGQIFALVWRFVNIHVLNFTPKYNYFATESRIGTILWGCLLAVLTHRNPTGFLKTIITSHWVGLIAGALLMATMFIPGEENRHSWRYSLQGLCLMLAVGSLLFSQGLGWARSVLEIKPMIFLGKISYSLYLWHLPVYFFLPKIVSIEHRPIFLLVSLILSTLFAALSYFLYAKPIMKWHRNRQHKAKLSR